MPTDPVTTLPPMQRRCVSCAHLRRLSDGSPARLSQEDTGCCTVDPAWVPVRFTVHWCGRFEPLPPTSK